MTLAARGAFVELLAYQFAYGSVPNDAAAICRIIGAFPKEWRAISEQVLSKFRITENGDLVNDRMNAERLEREEIRGKRVEAVSKRWNKRNTNVLQEYPICNDFVSTTTTTTTTLPTKVGSSSGGERCDWEILSSEGKYIEALSARTLVPVDELRDFLSQSPNGCADAYLRSRASEQWRTKRGRPINLENWRADFEIFREAFARNEGTKPTPAKPKLQGPPANWREIAARVLDRPVDGLEYQHLKHGEQLAIADAIRNA